MADQPLLASGIYPSLAQLGENMRAHSESGLFPGGRADGGRSRDGVQRRRFRRRAFRRGNRLES